MGRIEQLQINAYLSEVARGYANNTFVAENLFPTIESDLERVDIFEFNKEAFALYDTERAIRANSNVISPQGFTKKTATLTEHDLAYPLDYREEEESKKVKLQLHATNVVTEGLKLKHEMECASLVQNPDNYPTDNKIALSGDDVFTNYEFESIGMDESDTLYRKTKSDPLGVIEDGKDVISKKIAADPNTMVIGQDAFKALKRHPQLQSLISNNQNRLVTLEIMKEIFEIPNIYVGKSIFVNEKGEFVRVWGDSIVMAYVPNLITKTEYDPAFGYTIRKKNALQVDEYTKEGNKIRYIRATDIYSPFLVGAEAGYLISNTNG